MNDDFRMPTIKEAPPSLIPKPVPFEVYSKRYEGLIKMTREDGIVMMQLHNGGRPMIWARPIHRAVHMAVRDIASDPENKVLILVGTGKYWVCYGYDTKGMQSTGIDENNYLGRRNATIDDYTGDAMPLQENFIWDLHIPSIALINGPGYHMDMAMQCDLTLCTDDCVMFDVHKHMGFVSGDGVNLSMKEFMGSKRAAYYMLTGEPVTAQQAYDWGMVNKVVPRKDLLKEGWKLARKIRDQGRERPGWARYMVEVCRKPIKQRFANDFAGEFAMEMYAYMVDQDVSHSDEALIRMYNSGNVQVDAWESNPVEYYDIPAREDQ
jgi:enoyl-CoA hydratase/carnithine racemase